MHLVDTDAPRAMEDIIAGETDNWSGDLGSGWTRFILSLLFRNPEAVATIKGHIVEMWDEGIKALLVNYAARRRAGDPESFEEFLAKHEPNAAQIGAANFLADVIDNAQVGKTVFEMKWSRVDLSKSNHDLLTSDRPIDMSLGLADPKAYISLPFRRASCSSRRITRTWPTRCELRIQQRSSARTTSASWSRHASSYGAPPPRSSPSFRSTSQAAGPRNPDRPAAAGGHRGRPREEKRSGLKPPLLKKNAHNYAPSCFHSASGRAISPSTFRS
jgi:hypothetical protein